MAEQLKISLSMTYALISRGELICYEIGSCKRVKQSDLEMFLESKRKEVQQLPRNVGRHF
ncbi:helix-turn-helix domain-containing protein [Rubinisphaera italica]|uniref:helix-turn-helix domain-containing protein n=1 Tax=Rubinisphaera italica TaxID=2527969 RepID=UPI0021BCA402|nr:helix-turn-helix domain-containing protein [Rubinisphaera italica]